MDVFEYYEAAMAKQFTPMLFVKAPEGLPTVLLVGGGKYQVPHDTRVVLGPSVDRDWRQVGLPGGTFVYAAKLDHLEKQCSTTAEGARLFQDVAGSEDRSAATFIPYSRHVMGMSLRCYTMAGDTVTIPQGDFVTCGVTPNLLDSDVNIIKAVVNTRVHYVPFSQSVLRNMLESSTIILADGRPRTIVAQAIQDHPPAAQFVHIPPVTIVNDLVGCGANCQKVQVHAGEVVDWLFVDYAGLRYCRKRSTGEMYVFAYLTRDVQDRVEAIYDGIAFRGSMEADVDAALERFIVANDHPLFHGQNECDSCHHFFGVHQPGCANAT